MIRRIATVDSGIPVWFIYGGRSWIDHTAGFTSIHLRQNAISTSVKVIILFIYKSSAFVLFIKSDFQFM